MSPREFFALFDAPNGETSQESQGMTKSELAEMVERLEEMGVINVDNA